jgi:2-iminobutanoate/2-iminopropanoate deaminase
MSAVKKEIRIASLVEPASHYVDVVQAGELLFLSGTGPTDADCNLVGGSDPTEQARQTFRNMQVMLEAAGATFADICKVTVFVAHIKDLPAIDVARREFFGDAYPVSTLIEISKFVIPGMLLEVDAIAVVGAGRSRELVTV